MFAVIGLWYLASPLLCFRRGFFLCGGLDVRHLPLMLLRYLPLSGFNRRNGPRNQGSTNRL